MFIGHDRNAPAADGNNDHPGIDQRLDRRFFDNTHWQGGSHHTPPAPAGIFVAVPAVNLDTPLRVLFSHERADGLAGILEGWIVSADFDLGNDCGDRPVDTHVEKVILQALLQRVANGSLRVRAAHIEWYFVQFVGRQFGAAQDEADLRPVAVGDGDVPAVLDHLGDVARGFIGRIVLVFDRLVGFVFNQ